MESADGSDTHQPRYYGLLAGALAASASLAFGELVAGVSGTIPGLVLAVGEWIVDITPGDVAARGIDTAGTADKPILLWGISIVSILIGALLGEASERHGRAIGFAGFAVFGIFGGFAVARNPVSPAAAGWFWTLVATAVGGGVLAFLLDRLHRPTRLHTSFENPTDPGTTRRAFLAWSAGAGAAAVATAGVGRRINATSAAETARDAITLPSAPASGARATTVPATIGELVDASVGLSPYITPNTDFYRIDTALSTPKVDPANWKLSFTGLVDNPYELTYDDILAMDLEDHTITLSCVSNKVGGNLVGNATWTGVPLDALLDRAGVQDGAGQVIGRSRDDWTAGFPTQVIGDGRNALLAVGMNGEPLPISHGFPARLVVAGLYGYVSAVKWIEEINLTSWDGFDGFWIPRGWSKLGPMKTMSRIDVPKRNAGVRAGITPVAGVAWAPNRGISKVEISVDEGPWTECNLGEVTTDESWVQWHTTWDAPPGRHTISVRSYDGIGELQPLGPADPRPDGAEGRHTIRVDVA